MMTMGLHVKEGRIELIFNCSLQALKNHFIISFYQALFIAIFIGQLMVAAITLCFFKIYRKEKLSSSLFSYPQPSSLFAGLHRVFYQDDQWLNHGHKPLHVLHRYDER